MQISKYYQIFTKISLNISPNIFLPFAENVVKTQMAQDLGLISRRGVERLMRGDVDPDRLIEEAQHVKNVSAMDLYKKYSSISFKYLIYFITLYLYFGSLLVLINPIIFNSQRPRSSSKSNHHRGADDQRYTREKYHSDLIVPYNMSRMPVSKNKLYEVSNCIYTLNIDRLIIKSVLNYELAV